jgi:hypothetical protein
MNTNGPDPAPRVFTLEPTIEWWTSNNHFGNRYTGLIPDSDNFSIPILNIDALPGPPGPASLKLFRSDQQVIKGGPTKNSDFRARITYGAGGAANTFDMDWGVGGLVPLVANAIRIDAVTYAPNGDVPYLSAGGKIILGCTLGAGGQGAGLPPTLTSQIFELGFGATTNSLIPDFSRRVSPILNRIDGQPPVLSEYQLSFTGNYPTGLYEITASMIESGIGVPGACNRVTIRNTGVHATRVAFRHELGL